MPLILALDLGTSSTRTALFTDRGERLASTTAQEEYPLLTDSSGRAELSPKHLRDALFNCLRQTLEHHQKDRSLRSEEIVAAGASCFWHGLIGVDARQRPLTNVITWADARPAAAAAELRAQWSEREIHRLTGCMLRYSYWPAKLRWLRQIDRGLFRRVKRWMSPAEWLQLELCGEAHCGLAMGTGTGLFNPTTLAWDAALLNASAVEPSQMHPLTDDPLPTSRSLARQFPALRETLWYPGLGDGAASNLGSGATQPGVAAINVGTSAALRIMRTGKKAEAPFGLFAYRVDSERYLVGGAVSNAGNLRSWCLRELHFKSDSAHLEQQLAARPGPQADLVVLPFWTVERAPTWNEQVPATVLGVTQSTTALDLLQAITEATYHRMARIADLLSGREKAPKFLVSGGIQHSRSSMERLTNVLGRPTYVNQEPEASLRGAAIYAMEKLGWPIPALRLGRALRPQRKIARQYQEARARQTALEELLAHAEPPLQRVAPPPSSRGYSVGSLAKGNSPAIGGAATRSSSRKRKAK